MSVNARAIINGQFAPDPAVTVYTAPPANRIIIDKLTATNIDSGAQTLTVYVVPAGDSADDSNIVLDEFSIAAKTCVDFTELQNHILNAGDTIVVGASAPSLISIRASGRECT